MIKLGEIGITGWDLVFRKYEQGEPITRDEIHRALDSGDPMPSELNPLLREVVTRGWKTSQGRSPSEAVEVARELEQISGLVSHLVDIVAESIKDTTKMPDTFGHELRQAVHTEARQHKSKRRRQIMGAKSESPRDRAKRIVGGMFEVGQSTIRDITKKTRN